MSPGATKERIALSGPDLGEAEIAAVNEVLRSPALSMGAWLTRFEREFAEYSGRKHAIGVSSGTAALHLAMIAAGIEPGDEVITTPFSFVASANCVLYQRATPVFVDLDPETMNLDAGLIERTITKKTKALLPVHVFGLPCDMDRIADVARRHRLLVIEDACEAIGATWKSRKVGTFGECAVFAFYPNKQMTTGEGGMIVTDRDDWAELFRSLRNQGRGTDGAWLHHVRLGYNYRLDEMSAALGAVQLSRLEELLAKRSRVAAQYAKHMGDIESVKLPSLPAGMTRSWFVYVIQLAEHLDRDEIAVLLEKDGIPTRPYFSPIHLQPFYVEAYGYEPGSFPVTEKISRSTLALPFHNALSDSHIEHIADSLRRAIAAQSRREETCR